MTPVEKLRAFLKRNPRTSTTFYLSRQEAAELDKYITRQESITPRLKRISTELGNIAKGEHG